MRKEILILFGLALLVRGLAAWPQQQPNYFDASYSYVNALNLAAGRGFVEDFIWNYLNKPGLPPQPSHLYWMPLTSILAWLGMSLFGAGYRAAQIPLIVLSALLAPISYYVGFALSGKRWQGWLAGLLAIFSGFYFPFWTAIDNFTPFGIAASLALLAAWWGLETCPEQSRRIGSTRNGSNKGERWKWHVYVALAGVLVGLSHLARADGPLLLIVIFLVYITQSWKILSGPKNQAPDAGPPRSRLLHYAPRFTFYALRFTLLLTFGYLLVMSPWFWRNWQVTGTILPVSGSQTIWLTDYDDLFSYDQQLSPGTFFAQGLATILRGRGWALWANLQTALAVWGMIFLAPLALIGGWRLRGHLLIQLAGWYALLLFVAMTLVFAFPGARGGLFHSGTALLPFIYGAAAIGLDQAVDWAAARRRRWQAGAAKQVFGVGIIIMAIALSSFIYYRRVLQNNSWNNADSTYQTIVAWVSEQNPQATVMIGNPPAYRYFGGGLSVAIPNEDIETTLQVANIYQVDYLILDRNHPQPLADLYHNPTGQPSLTLVQTFGQGPGQGAYVFEIKHNTQNR